MKASTSFAASISIKDLVKYVCDPMCGIRIQLSRFFKGPL